MSQEQMLSTSYRSPGAEVKRSIGIDASRRFEYFLDDLHRDAHYRMRVENALSFARLFKECVELVPKIQPNR